MMSASLPTADRARAGFTLPELLLASVLGAMLLTGLAVSTFGFVNNLDHLEKQAGVGSDADPVLRRMTREIREAWFVEHPAAKTLHVYDPSGARTKYWVEGADLWVERPDGNEGMLLTSLTDFTMQSIKTARKREAAPVAGDGVWYAASVSGVSPVAVPVTQDQAFSLAFTAPVLPADIPGHEALDEQIQSVQLSVVNVPLAWKHSSGGNSVTVSIFEGWAPGGARPYGSALASVNMAGGSLPLATQVDGVWNVPEGTTPISLPATLVPGVGYTIMFTVNGNNTLVLQGLPVVPSIEHDQTALRTNPGSPWTVQPYVVPFSLSGPWVRTGTAVSQVVLMVTLTAYPTDRPLQQRSAAVLSQAFTSDPWLGVVFSEVP